MERAKLPAVQLTVSNFDLATLRAYRDVIEHGPDSQATLTRGGTDAMRVRAALAPGQSIIVQESYDPAWHAAVNGTELTVRKDTMGFIAIEAPPGDQEISLTFVTPLENRVGRVVTILGLLCVLALLVRGRRYQE